MIENVRRAFRWMLWSLIVCAGLYLEMINLSCFKDVALGISIAVFGILMICYEGMLMCKKKAIE